MEVVKSWFKHNGKHLLDALFLLLFTIMGSTLPLWGGALLIRLSDQWQSWSTFCFGGEFAIYSAALLAPILYIVLKDYRKTQRSLIQFPVIIMLLTSAILFAGVKSRELLGLTVDRLFLRDITLVLFISSLFVYYIVHFVEYARVDADLKKAQQKALRSLEKKFDELGG